MSERNGKCSVAEALGIIERKILPLGQEQVPLSQALGRFTAEPIDACIDVPRFAASAMDGYALHSRDVATASLERPIRLALGVAVAAGRWPSPLSPLFAVPISTGAPVPAGADTILVREQAQICRHRGISWLQVERPIASGLNVRAIGEDARVGERVVEVGRLVTPDVVGALAAYGVETIPVRRVPHVGLLSLGTELAEDQRHFKGPADIIDSNTPMLAASIQALGLTVSKLGRFEDTKEAHAGGLSIAASEPRLDLLLSSGGASHGDHDLIRGQLIAAGAQILIDGVHMRPGKPVLFALLADGRPFFALPGNPVAALVGFRFFVTAGLRRLLGLAPESGRGIDVDAPSRSGTTLFLRGRSNDRQDARCSDTDLDQRSHVLRSVLAADEWIRLEDRDGKGFALAYPKTPALFP